MKNRECMYCKNFFECKGRANVDFCIRFEQRSEEAKKNYEEWRKLQSDWRRKR